MKNCKALCTQVSLVADESVLGSSADGGKTLEPNCNYSISNYTHTYTLNTHTHPSTPVFTHLNTRNYTVTAQDWKTNKRMVLFRLQAQWLCIFMANFTHKRTSSRQSLQHLKSKHCDWKHFYTLIVRLRNRYFCAISHANDKYFTAMKLASQSSSILSK